MFRKPFDDKAPVSADVDRRSQRTRDALRDALLLLLLERGWDEIAVQHVCDRANVGRSTFYSHYPSKDALLVGGFDALRAGLQLQLRASATSAANDPASRSSTPDRFYFVRGLIEHAYEQQQIFRGLIGRRSGHVVHLRFREMVVQLVTDELPATGDPLLSQAAARALSGAFVELLSWWVEHGAVMPKEQLESLFDSMAQPILRVLRGA